MLRHQGKQTARDIRDKDNEDQGLGFPGQYYSIGTVGRNWSMRKETGGMGDTIVDVMLR